MTTEATAEQEKANVPVKPHYVLVVQSARHALKLIKQEGKENGKVVE